MLVHVCYGALKETKARISDPFRAGGLATAATGAIAKYFGPGAGGLPLAFPAILCTSLTLIEKHERTRKAQKGLKGARRDKDAARASLAGIGLAAFGWTIWRGASTAAGLSWLVLAVALLAWTAVSLNTMGAVAAVPVPLVSRGALG